MTEKFSLCEDDAMVFFIAEVLWDDGVHFVIRHDQYGSPAVQMAGSMGMFSVQASGTEEEMIGLMRAVRAIGFERNRAIAKAEKLIDKSDEEKTNVAGFYAGKMRQEIKRFMARNKGRRK